MISASTPPPGRDRLYVRHCDPSGAVTVAVHARLDGNFLLLDFGEDQSIDYIK